MSASELRARVSRLGRKTLGMKVTNDSHINAGDERTALLDHGRPFRNLASGSGRGGDSTQSWPRRVFGTVWDVLRNSYMNLLLVFVPLGIASGVVGWPPMATFVLNFLGIVPLAALLSFATEELAATLGPSIGGLVNASFGNAIELIVSIIALSKDKFRLVQASILGSVLVNILLVLGCCFIAGGIGHSESKYDPTVAGIMSALQTLAASALVVPAILYATLLNSEDGDTIEILPLSRGTAIILILLYIVYLVFQLKTHDHLFRDDTEDGDEPAISPEQYPGLNEYNPEHPPRKTDREEGDTLGPWGALVTLVVTTVCVGFCAEFLVDSVDDIVASTPMSETFIGIILIPIISNAAEHVTAVIVSYKGKMNLALLVDLGSGMQIALFVTPLLVLLAWAMDKPLSLHFQLFETVVFFVSVLVVNFMVRGGQSNYLEGCMCVGWYAIIALAFFYYKEPKSLYGTPS